MKKKLYIMQGLPASGKSTKAKELVEKDTEHHTVRLNRDLLREMLHFGKYSTRTERHVMNVEKLLAKYFIVCDSNVIVDDTNLKKKTLDMWHDVKDELLAVGHKVELEIIRMDTPIEECIERDKKREKSVGEKVIRKMVDWDLFVDSH